MNNKFIIKFARNSQRYCNTEVTFEIIKRSECKHIIKRYINKKYTQNQFKSICGFRNHPNQSVWENIPSLRDQAEKN